MTETAQQETEKQSDFAPVIIDLGKQKRKDVKRLRNGEGDLLDVAEECIEELRSNGSISGAVQPVIVVVREKRRTRSLPWT